MGNLNDDYMTVADICRKLGVNRDTVYSWLQAGDLESIRLTSRGRYLVRRDAFDAVFGARR